MGKHGSPGEGMECACCYDDIDGENYVEYSTSDEGNAWLPSLFCEGCITILLKRQWPIFEEGLGKATCKAQQKRMLGDGPPTHVHDKKALPCPDGESVRSLWFMRDGQVRPALLEGAPQGEARQIWWDEKLAFQFDEDDEDDQDEGKSSNQPPPAPAQTGPPNTSPPRALATESNGSASPPHAPVADAVVNASPPPIPPTVSDAAHPGTSPSQPETAASPPSVPMVDATSSTPSILPEPGSNVKAEAEGGAPLERLKASEKTNTDTAGGSDLMEEDTAQVP